VSSISGTGQVSVSVNGSTILIGVPNAAVYSGYNPYADLPITFTQNGQGSVLIDPNAVPTMQFDRILVPIYFSASQNSTATFSLSAYVGIYSQNVSTLSLVGSASSLLTVNMSTNVSYSLYSGLRHLSIGSTTTLPAGKYWMAFGSSTNSAGGANGSFSNVVEAVFTSNNASLGFNGFMGASQNNSQQFTLGQGFYSAATAGMPASIAFSQIVGSSPIAQNAQMLMFASSTV